MRIQKIGTNGTKMSRCVPAYQEILRKRHKQRTEKRKKIIHIRLFLHKMAFIDNRPPSNIKWGDITY